MTKCRDLTRISQPLEEDVYKFAYLLAGSGLSLKKLTTEIFKDTSLCRIVECEKIIAKK
jgi:hypothetical protein